MKTLGERYGQTILLVTHDERIAQVADRVFLMKDGKMSVSDGKEFSLNDNGESIVMKESGKLSAIGGTLS